MMRNVFKLLLHKVLETDLWPSNQNISRDHLLIWTFYQPSFLGKAFLSFSLNNVFEIGITLEVPWEKRSWFIRCIRCWRQTWLWTWHTYLNINKDRLLIKNYQYSKFKASRTKRSLVYRLSVAQCMGDRHADRPTYAKQYAHLSSKGKGHK